MSDAGIGFGAGIPSGAVGADSEASGIQTGETISRERVDELVQRIRTGGDEFAIGELQQIAAGFGGEGLPAGELQSIQRYAQDQINELTRVETYTPYHDPRMGNERHESSASARHAGRLNPNQEVRDQIRAMSPQERLRKFRDDLAFVLSGGDPTGFGDEFTPASVLEGYEDPETGQFTPGFESMDFRLGDSRNQHGRLPGMAKEDRTAFEQEFHRAGTHVGWMLEDMTPREIRSLMISMPPDELAKFQRALDDAGLYSESAPVFGMISSEDWNAFDQLTGMSKLNPNKSVPQLLEDLTRNNLGSILEQSQIIQRARGASNQVASLTSAEALRQMGEEISYTLSGRRASTDVLERGVAAVHAAERQAATARFNASGPSDALLEHDGDVSVAERDEFLDAMGGVGQFHPVNWKHWSQQVFGGPVEQTPQNKRVVAHAMADHYHRRYGNWATAAEAIMNGPEAGVFAKLRWDLGTATSGLDQYGLPQAVPSAKEFGHTVASRMAAATASLAADSLSGSGQGRGNLTFVETPDADAILNRELRAADEVGYQSWQFADAAQNFYSLLGSLY